MSHEPAPAVARGNSVQRQLRLFASLALRPREGARAVLAQGTLLVAFVAMFAACAIAAMNASRFAASTAVSDLVYGSQRSPLVNLLLDAIGTARTAVVVYLAEQAWTAVIVLTAATPLLVWLLGATAVHAAARLAEAGRAFSRFFVFAGYATALALVPSGLVSLALEGSAGSLGAAVARAAGLLFFVWLGLLLYRGIEAYYQVAPTRALTILVVAVTVFYLVPLLLIAVTIVAIVVAAVVLELA